MSDVSDLTLPSPPGAALRLLELYGDPRSDIGDMVEVISMDATLSARLLRVANSPLFGQRRDVGSLQRAIVVLGTDYVKVVALGFQLLESCRSWEDSPIDIKALWRGNLLRACLARQISLQSKVFPQDCRPEAFLVGLIQDLAVPLVARRIGSDYRDWLFSGGLCTTLRTCEFEIAATNVSHAGLVERTLEHWDFPRRISSASGKHHTPPPTQSETAADVCLWQLAYFVGTTPFNEDQSTATVSQELRDLARTAFALEGAALARVFYGAVDDYDALAPVFKDALSGDGPTGANALREAWRLVNRPETDASGKHRTGTSASVPTKEA